MKYLKLALFSFICAIVFVLAAEILHVEPLYFLVVLAILACVAFLVVWLCTVIFHRFQHSLNVILIIIFLAISVVAFIFQPEAVHIATIADIARINYLSLIGIISALACCVSILALIARLIFSRKPVEMPVVEDVISSEYIPTDDHQQQ